MHQPHGERLRCRIAPAEKHDLSRTRVTHGFQQALVALDVVGEAELRCRDAELRRGAAIAQVAGKRHLEPAAHAKAVNHRHAGLERVLDRVQHAVEQIVILGNRAALGARLVEFRDVGAGGERLGTGARNATQRTPRSASKRAIASGMPRHMAPLIALRRFGLSKTIQPTLACFSIFKLTVCRRDRRWKAVSSPVARRPATGLDLMEEILEQAVETPPALPC